MVLPNERLSPSMFLSRGFLRGPLEAIEIQGGQGILGSLSDLLCQDSQLGIVLLVFHKGSLLLI